MSELKILGKIDLSQLPKRKEFVNFSEVSGLLTQELFNSSQEINENYGSILESDGSIKMVGEDIDLHQEVIRLKESAWADEESLDIEIRRSKKEKNPANLAEKAINLILHQALKDRFIVARASKYDDYEHGIDHVLIDKQTGAVVCGFDQVLGRGQDDGSISKRSKLEKIMSHGGAELEYGLSLDEEGKIVQKKIKDIPAFFLAISKEDLDKLLLGIKKNDHNRISFNKEVSQIIFKKMISSLEEQSLLLNNLLYKNKEANRYQRLSKNINKFKDSLDIIKQIVL